MPHMSAPVIGKLALSTLFVAYSKKMFMKVFLDTNAFYNNWFVDNANFKLLFHYLNNEEFDLLLSNLVAQEVNNIRERELVEILLTETAIFKIV